MDNLEIKEGSTSSSSNDEESVENRKKRVRVKSTNGIEDASLKAIDFFEVERDKKKSKQTKKVRRKISVSKDNFDRLKMVLPDIVADRTKERALAKIATKGVVQLFNAVSEWQTKLEKQSSLKKDPITGKKRKSEFGRADFEARIARMGEVKGEITLKNDDLANTDEDEKPTSEAFNSSIKIEQEDEED